MSVAQVSPTGDKVVIDDHQEPRKLARFNHTKFRVAVLLVSLLATAFSLAALPSPAQAVTVRPGAGFGQVDLLLDSYETDKGRRDAWSASVICWNSGLVGTIGMALCVPMVSVCAARAYYSSPRRRAGITFTIWGNAWCWKY